MIGQASKQMRRANFSLFFFAAVLLVLMVVALLDRAGVPSQFYVWEFKIDLKPILFFGLCYFFAKKYSVQIGRINRQVWKWSWKVNLLAFFSPVFLCGTVILAGLISKGIVYQGVDNAATFLLGILIDIPAFFFFSATTLLLEEIVFRGYVFHYISSERSFIAAVLLTSALWGLLFYVNFFDVRQLSFSSIAGGFIYLVSIGFVCSSLFYYSRSIWSSYSFRVGLATFLIPLLCGKLDDANSFFVSGLSPFSNSGIILSSLNFIFAACIFKASKPQIKPQFSV